MIVFACVFLTSGCSNFDGNAIRREHAENYRKTISEKTAKILSDGNSLSLDDCVQIALRNNLGIKTSEIQKRIAKLEKKVAFSYFLPSVNLNYNYTRWDPQPKINFGSDAVAMHDRRIRDITWEINMTIFDPSTWFLYSMHQRGEEIAELIGKYVKQMTVLQVTTLYYHCLSLHEVEKALESQLTAAVVLGKAAGAFKQEGLITQWQAKQAKMLVLGRQTALHRTQYAFSQAKADLLVAMGLSPIGDISLDLGMLLQVPEKPLEELVLESLLSHPQVHIADREIAIEQEKVKVAIAGFLPRLTGLASRTHSSDSFLKYRNFWTTGLTGTLSLFNGFASINEYEAAKQRQKKAFVQREERALTLILEVIKAYLNLKNAEEEMLLARKYYDMESTHFTEIEQQWKEGLNRVKKELVKIM